MYALISTIQTKDIRYVSSKNVPQQKDQTQSYHASQDDRVPPFLNIYLVNQVVDEREFVGEVIQFGLDCLENI